ncbi:PepSY-associated TM helix domain-containing protein [Bacillus rubiinfantis]|uniref:PepSY-associated TM helix domain-containing protein n=1 Tax=Bacillus rubiinfantis TaxID=1499680 RepID=UPI0005A89FEE|nr:PepSY-associated TM helix domain-containing protein [Bacillus rubiinfantis]
MKKTRKAHLWIGLICSILILMESITGLIMNEPWLIGQSQTIERGNFQPGQIPQQQGTTDSSSQTGDSSSQTTKQSQGTTNNQTTTNQNGTTANGQFPGPGGNFDRSGLKGDNEGSGSFMSIIKGLHEGRIGTTNIKWLIDLTAVAMIFLTGSGIYLSMKILRADKRRKKGKIEAEAV